MTTWADAVQRGYVGFPPGGADGDWLTVEGVARPAPAGPPVLTALEPASAVLGGEPFRVVARGSGITRDTVVVFSGNVERTDAVDGESCSTFVNLPLWADPVVVEVRLRSALGESAPVNFAFVAA